MFSNQFDTSIPIYSQIINQIKHALARGVIKPGDKLPSQRELADILSVNANTVQRAYRDMEHSQLVKTLRGQGTFINQDKELIENIKTEMIEEIVNNFISEMLSLGCSREQIMQLVEKEVSRRCHDE